VDTAYSLPFLPHVPANAAPEPCAEEAVWLTAAQRGESWALEAFYNGYQDRVFGLCRRLLVSPEDARDATQVSFVRAFRELPRFRGHSTVRTWVYRIAVNESLSMLRRRRETTGALDENATDGDGEPSLVERLAVRAALEQTKPAHRTILVLRFWEGLSCDEMALVLGISVSAVKMRLKRARDEFRHYYEIEL
jgi:RNA polymerase sigma-70 factor (ECF subfamily)